MEFKYQNTFESKLKLCISLIISNWPILKIVIENDLVQKNQERIKRNEETLLNEKNEIQLKQDLIDGLTQFILDHDVQDYDVEDYLVEYIDTCFYVDIEDESEKQIVEFIMKAYKDLMLGSDKVMNQYIDMAKSMGDYKVTYQIEKIVVEGESMNDQTNQESQKSKKETIIDDDGFQVVQKKKK